MTSAPTLEQVIEDYLYGWDYYNSDAIEGLASRIEDVFRIEFDPMDGVQL